MQLFWGNELVVPSGAAREKAVFRSNCMTNSSENTWLRPFRSTPCAAGVFWRRLRASIENESQVKTILVILHKLLI
jgi:hypothetical protein